MKAKSGFTLVEILIVVVILGILAAIVIPQFTSASTEAKESALVSDLQSIRSQIELYKIHHNDELPGAQATNNFVTAMTESTNQDGETAAQAADPCSVRYGPYMREIPVNPFSTAVNGENSVSESSTVLSGKGDNVYAWHFVNGGADAGLFQAQDDKANPLDPADWHTGY
jgi:type II secretion system protein G